MDEFDFKQEEQPRKRFRFGSAIWNCASIFLILCSLAAIALYALLFMDPQSGLNPFPPVAATATTAATNTLQPTDAITSVPSETPTLTPTATQEPTITPTSEPLGSIFAIQEGSPSAVDGSVFHPELACNFMGVAGQAFGTDSSPIADLQVQISGTLDGESINKTGLTGAATQFGSGSYYEVQLANEPIASDATLQVILLDATGQALSTPFTFNTTDSCQQNLIFINFVEMP